MTWYVALVAIANLGLGYALAVYLRSDRGAAVHETGGTLDAASGEWLS